MFYFKTSKFYETPKMQLEQNFLIKYKEKLVGTRVKAGAEDLWQSWRRSGAKIGRLRNCDARTGNSHWPGEM
jgi:hypothetical protein